MITAKADQGPARRARAPLVEFLGVCLYTCTYTYTFIVVIIHVYNYMYLILYCHLKHMVCVNRTPKQTPDPKNSTAPGPRPPVLKFLDPPLEF